MLMKKEYAKILYGGKKSINATALQNDGLFGEEFNHIKVDSNEDENIDPNDIYLKEKNFKTIFKNNLKILHPLLGIFSPSILQPQYFNMMILLFNIYMIFGFNALIYPESMIEKRIFNKHRDNMFYPILNEFSKIISSIFATICLTLVIRLINLTSFKKKSYLEKDIKEKEKNEIIEQYNNEMRLRRLIGGLLMLIISIFFCYYVTVFCAVYKNTQIGWLYSVLWSLIFNWLCFSIIYILIISVIEYTGTRKNSYVTYFLKRLFVF